MGTTSSWKKRVEKGVLHQDRRNDRWYDEHDVYKRHHWILKRKNGVRLGAFSGVQRQSSVHSSCGDETVSDEDEEEDDVTPMSPVSRL